MVQGAAADRMAHAGDRGVAWEETKGSSNSPAKPCLSRGPWPQSSPLPLSKRAEPTVPTGRAQEMPAWSAASALHLGPPQWQGSPQGLCHLSSLLPAIPFRVAYLPCSVSQPVTFWPPGSLLSPPPPAAAHARTLVCLASRPEPMPRGGFSLLLRVSPHGHSAQRPAVTLRPEAAQGRAGWREPRRQAVP